MTSHCLLKAVEMSKNVGITKGSLKVHSTTYVSTGKEKMGAVKNGEDCVLILERELVCTIPLF